MTTMHVLLACMMTLLWVLLTQSAGALNIMFGFTCAIIGLIAVRRAAPQPSDTPSRLKAMLRFAFLTLKDLLVSSLWIAWDVITPKHYSTPGLFRCLFG